MAGLTRQRRLRSNRQFKAVLDRKQRLGDRHLVVSMAPNTMGYPRLGVSVGRSCGTAVVRNRLKRLVREAFRAGQDRLPQGFDYVVVVRPQAGSARSGTRTSQREPIALTDVQHSFEALTHALMERRARP